MAGIEARHPRTLGLSRAIRQDGLKSQPQTTASKVRGDTFALPIAVAGGLGSLRSLQFLRRRRGVGSSSLPARFRLGQRALGGRRERLAIGNGGLVTHLGGS